MLTSDYLTQFETTDDINIRQVSEVNALAKSLLEEQLGTLWITGEISNFVCPRSGHWYFTLKDDQSQLRCALFKPYQANCPKPEDGMHVVISGQVSLYTVRGDYQCMVTQLYDAGLGKLQRAFEQLKKQLQAQGMFDAERKKSLPQQVQRLGIITSATGAAIRDVISVIERRCPYLEVVLYPCLVQGEQAPDSIQTAINQAHEHNHVDLLLVVRGGGSLEDLWAFNDLKVIHAIADSNIPIITGIGHEIDMTLSDWVADLRAATPTAAAELATPDCQQQWHRCRQLIKQLSILCQQQVQHGKLSLTAIRQRLQHPRARLQMLMQTVDQLEQRLYHQVHRLLTKNKQHYQLLIQRFDQPALGDYQLQLISLYQRMNQTLYKKWQHNQQQLAELLARLQVLDPEATLQRGYAIAKLQGKILLSSKQVSEGDIIALNLADGQLSCEVKAND